MDRVYIAIDLKSFYASAECVDRGLDPLRTNLVVADESRTEQTICLAVSPALKSFGVPGRPRLFEVVQQVSAVNARRLRQAPSRRFTGSSYDLGRLTADSSLRLDYIVAPPRMARYIEISAEIYRIYLKYVSPQDIHVYSIDEVFIDATGYLRTYGMTARQLAMRMILYVLKATGITATAGIGTNLYLCKVALDIGAKHIKTDENGVRIAELDEQSYRRTLWDHQPITDFWRVGPGYAKKLRQNAMHTMGDIALRSTWDEDTLYRLFGVNAELLIDHAWGWEPCTIAQIKAYRPRSSSLGSGQVMQCPYTFQKARQIVREMADSLSLALMGKELAARQIVLDVGYDVSNITPGGEYDGPTVIDRYGRMLPKPAHGSKNLDRPTSASSAIIAAALEIYDRTADPRLLVRRINISAGGTMPASEAAPGRIFEQLDLFGSAAPEPEAADPAREERRQRAILDIRRRFGKNAIFKGMELEEGSMELERGRQIGGHKA